MENVANSKKYLKSFYTFKDLSLQDWASMHNLNPNAIAIDLRGNSEVINAGLRFFPGSKASNIW